MLCRLCQGCVAVVSGSRARIIIIIISKSCLFLREARLTHLTHGNIYTCAPAPARAPRVRRRVHSEVARTVCVGERDSSRAGCDTTLMRETHRLGRTASNGAAGLLPTPRRTPPEHTCVSRPVSVATGGTE